MIISLTTPRERPCNAKVLCAYRSYPVLEVTRKPASHRCARAVAFDVLLPPRSFVEGHAPTDDGIPTAQQHEAVIRIAAFAPAANKANGDGAIGCTAR
jgi:hypothetical protein